MLSLDHRMMEQLEEAQALRLARRLAADVVAGLPHQPPMAPQQLVPDMLDLMARAAEYGFATERDIAVFVMVAVTLGPEFDKVFPVAREILLDPTLPPGVKSGLLAEYCDALFAALERP